MRLCRENPRVARGLQQRPDTGPLSLINLGDTGTWD